MCLPVLKRFTVNARQEREGKKKTTERSVGKAPTPAEMAGTARYPPPIAFIPAADLVQQRSPSVAVVDVRDGERQYDGHIAGSLYYPSCTFEETIPDLLRDLSGRSTAVFHCAKSQIRGPTCARMLVEHLNKSRSAGTADKQQLRVVVLERGFDGWAAAGWPVCSCKDDPCTHKP